MWETSPVSPPPFPDLKNKQDVSQYFATLAQRPVELRCLWLSELLSLTQMSYDNLRDFFKHLPLVLDSIFGVDKRSGWVDECVSENDVFQLEAFLSADSEFFAAVRQCASDERIVFAFSTARLPISSRQLISAGDVTSLPPLYTSRLRYMQNDKDLQNIRLNAFEYYMFCFAYFVGYSPAGTVDTYNAPSSTGIVSNLFYGFQGQSSGGLGSPRLFGGQPRENAKRDIFQNLVDKYLQAFAPYSGSIASPAPVRVGQRSPGFTTAETSSTPALVVQIFAEFWLNRAAHPRSSMRTDFPMPSRELLFALLRFVRFLLADPAVGAPSAVPAEGSGRRPPHSSTTVALASVQKLLYNFIRVALVRMPPDGPVSIALVVDLWLSFVQPWKVKDEALAPPPPGYMDPRFGDPYSRERHRPWLPFVVSNVLFYTNVLVDFLSMARTLSYADPDFLLLIEDVLAVYSKDLVDDLKACEETILDEQHSHRPSSKMGHFTNLIRSHLVTMEGMRYNYPPVFLRVGQSIEAFPPALTDILKELQNASNANRPLRAQALSGGRSTWISGGSSWLHGQFTAPTQGGSPYDRVALLTMRLVEIFSISVCTLCGAQKEPAGTPSVYCATCQITGSNVNAVPLAGGLERHATRRRIVFGEEATLPVTSRENVVLARLAFRLSSFLNRRLGLPKRSQDMTSAVRGAVRASRALNVAFCGPIHHDLVPSRPADGGLEFSRTARPVQQGESLNLRFLSAYSLWSFLAFLVILIWFILPAMFL